MTDPEMMLALAERHRAMEERGRTLAIQAIESRAHWIQRLGAVPSDSVRRSLWLHEVSTVAAYRERWHISGQRDIGNQSEVGSTEQVVQRQRAQNACERAVAIGRESNWKESNTAWDPQIAGIREVEL